MTTHYSDAEQVVDQVINRIGKTLVLAAPLGLGKPIQVINAFYQRACQDPTINLHIVTALSLEKPCPKSDVEARLAGPILNRLFGDYPGFDYMRDLRGNRIPSNITLSEFYFKAGSMNGSPYAQQHYISTNYTHVVRDVMNMGVNVVVQLVASREQDGELQLSLSSNPDTSLDLVPLLDARRDAGEDYCAIAQIHPDMPFMVNDAQVAAKRFDYIVANEAYNTTLFAPPNMSVPDRDYIAGLYASALIPDGGTLQIGIGSLSDAISYACMLRQQDNATYQQLLKSLKPGETAKTTGDTGTFEEGLYVSSEMFVNGFMHLINAGIIKRKVFDDISLQRLLNNKLITTQVSLDTLTTLLQQGVIHTPLDQASLDYLSHWGVLQTGVTLVDDQLHFNGSRYSNDISSSDSLSALKPLLGKELKGGIILHGGFFLGPEDFYQNLRDLSDELRHSIGMTSVGRTNQLFQNVELYSLQRKKGRFINTGMMVTLGGAVVSDGLENGTVISGVGGQYNFVAMAHELPDARSVICIRATRGTGKQLKSNIVPHYGHTTIPRHLRDIVITEYGIADLRGKTDAEVIQALIQVADSRFQNELLEYGKAHGKLADDYAIPKQYQHNTPEALDKLLAPFKAQGLFPKFPLGTQLTDQEIALASSLKDIKALTEDPKAMLKAVIKALVHKVDNEEAKPYLERMGLDHPHTSKELLIQQLLLLELEEHGHLRPV